MVERAQSAERNNPESLFPSQLMGREVQHAPKKLTEKFRMGIVLVDIGELTYKEAGKVMGCPIGTVRSRVSQRSRILKVAVMSYAIEWRA